MKIAFRVDSSDLVGLGHMSRCITLAKVFKSENCKVIFICKEIDDFSTLTLKKNNILIFKIKNNLNEIQDGQASSKIIKKQKIDITFLDNYGLNIRWERIVSLVNKIAWIDDFYRRKSIADYYINYHPNLYGKKLNKLKKDCKKLIGLEFIILKKKKTKVTKKNNKIFAYFGAVDSQNLAGKLLYEINKIKLKNHIFTIFVKNNFLLEKILNSRDLKRKNNINLINSTRSDIMKHMMLSKKIISQVGVTFYEALSTGNDVICLPTNSYQKKLIKSLSSFFDFKIIKNFQNLKKIIFQKQNKSPNNLNRNLLDGYGAKRIVEYILNKKNYSLRNFEKKDLLSLYSLRKDFITQKYALNQSDFSFNSHTSFFEKLTKSKIKLFIFHSKKNFIGQVRLEKSKKIFEIDYGINPLYRDRSLSYKMLKLVFKKIKNLKVDLVAKVRNNNLASINVFKRLGFSIISQNKKLIFFRKNYAK